MKKTGSKGVGNLFRYLKIFNEKNIKINVWNY